MEQGEVNTVAVLARRLKEKLSLLKSSVSAYIVLSYSVFLLICLALVLILCMTINHHAEESFWDDQATKLEIGISTLRGYQTTMQAYTQQLLMDPAFIQLSHLNESDASAFTLAADNVMGALASLEFSLIPLPVTGHHLYLDSFDDIIDASLFSEMEPYYRSTRQFNGGAYDEWLSMLTSATEEGAFISASPFTGEADSWFYVVRIRSADDAAVSAVHWFELDVSAIHDLFLPAGAHQAALYLFSGSGTLQLALGQTEQLSAIDYDEQGMADLNGMRYIRRTDTSGWACVLALPHSMSSAALGRLPMLAAGVFLLSLLVGLILVVLLAHRAMKSYHHLNRHLSQAQDDNASLQRQMDEHRPAIQASHLRKLLSGHVASAEEFAYIMHDLSLEGDLCYYVLLCVARNQDSTNEEDTRHPLILSHIEEYLTGKHPLHHYSMLNEDVVVLIAYDADEPDPLMDIQQRVLALHGDLAENHGIWFYAGVGERCTQPQRLWESYEHAREAARYTAQDHIFLPYEFIGKSEDTWYYPVEFTAKLLHFITTGNQEQVSEMFALIHRENIKERTLSVQMLSLLLSDLKNTLVKARFQIPPGVSEDTQAALAQLDERLNEPPTFPALEQSALMLCDFFTRAAEPANPVPEIVQYLQDHFTDPSLSLSDLSNRFNISQSYLSHMFKDRTGQNFSAYLEQLRVTEAARRLQEPGCNLSTLHLDIGYTNATTLRRAFKRHFGMNPSEMRK